MIQHLMRTKHRNISFNILFYPQYQNEHGQIVCHPGSVFEGVVKVKVTEPTSIHHIKLVFKASERVNYDAMGWERSKTSDDRLFAVRTVLWGLPSDADIPMDVWPTLEAGEYDFPFVCQMPMINFPPTFQHHLIATTFHMVVAATTKANEPILSKPVPIHFHPIIETIPIKNLTAFSEVTRLTNTVSAIVSVPRLAYNMYDNNQSIPVTVQFRSDTKGDTMIPITQLRVHVKRYYNINYKTFSRSEATVITQHEHPIKSSTTVGSILTMKLNLPSGPEALPATLTYSPHLTVEYKLVVSAKVRHGPINIKKRLFDMPLIFGTLPAGTRAPRQLEPYSNMVENRSAVHSKPNFLRPEPRTSGCEEEFLPAYDTIKPPDYYHDGKVVIAGASDGRIIEII